MDERRKEMRKMDIQPSRRHRTHNNLQFCIPDAQHLQKSDSALLSRPLRQTRKSATIRAHSCPIVTTSLSRVETSRRNVPARTAGGTIHAHYATTPHVGPLNAAQAHRPGQLGLSRAQSHLVVP